MSGRTAAIWLLLLLVLGLGWQAQRSYHRLAASRTLAVADADLLAAARLGRAPVQVFNANLAALEAAMRADPLEVGLPLTYGSYQLLLRHPEAARLSYLKALGLEPRPEIYLNLGRALRALGREDEARHYTDLALRLSPSLASGRNTK